MHINTSFGLNLTTDGASVPTAIHIGLGILVSVSCKESMSTSKVKAELPNSQLLGSLLCTCYYNKYFVTLYNLRNYYYYVIITKESISFEALLTSPIIVSSSAQCTFNNNLIIDNIILYYAE